MNPDNLLFLAGFVGATAAVFLVWEHLNIRRERKALDDYADIPPD